MRARADIGIAVLDEPAALRRSPVRLVDVDRDALDEGRAMLGDARGTSASTDPLALYMRRMQAVPLLTREGEIVLAREIETGRHQILHALAGYPAVDALLARHRARLRPRSRVVR